MTLILKAVFSLPLNQIMKANIFIFAIAATMLAAQTIQLGINDVVVAGGMESMSNVPKYLAEARLVTFQLNSVSGNILYFFFNKSWVHPNDRNFMRRDDVCILMIKFL